MTEEVRETLEKTLNYVKGTVLALSAATLTGCTGVSFSVDSLLAAPTLTDEQSQIRQTLTSAVGRNIILKYPRAGENRSAFVIANLDDDPTEEALVFYEYAGSESEGIRMNLLDKNEEGSWYSVKEIAGAGTEIEQVVVSETGTGTLPGILVCYQNVTGDKAFEVYTYSEDTLTRIGADSYLLLESIDINSDGKDDLVTIQRVTDPETNTVQTKAFCFPLDSGSKEKGEGIDVCLNVQSYIAAYKGILANGSSTPAVFIDELTTDGMLQTEILYYRYSLLQNPVRRLSDKLIPATTRPTGYTCADLEGNGEYLVPTTSPMLGYEDVIPEEQVLKTTWNSYSGFYEFTPKFTGYHSVADGYTMVFPQRWANDVTVKTDPESGEAVFYKYEGSINSEMTELMRIKTVTKDESDEFLYKGYKRIVSRGQLDFLVKIPTNKRERLILTIDEVQNNFYPISRY
ncbi:MAG: hypothetical protein K6B74_10160 [Ruminococcus sp.]|nr:hypothetical protein [Ruminococcus sp.]